LKIAGSSSNLRGDQVVHSREQLAGSSTLILRAAVRFSSMGSLQRRHEYDRLIGRVIGCANKVPSDAVP